MEVVAVAVRPEGSTVVTAEIVVAAPEEEGSVVIEEGNVVIEAGNVVIEAGLEGLHEEGASSTEG